MSRPSPLSASGSTVWRCSFDLPGLRAEVARLEAEAARPDLWSDRDRALATLRRLDLLRRRIERWDGFKGRAAELADVAPLALEDAAIAADLSWERMEARLLELYAKAPSRSGAERR